MRRTARAPSAPVPKTTQAASPLHAFWIGAMVFGAALLAYAPALKAGFIWNDADYVTAPELRSWFGLARIWFELGATEQFYPILHSAFWIEHKFWGDSAFGYHLVIILQHAGAACLLALVLRRLAIPGAWLAAFVFALHPVGVESVAWISEQKNTLSLVFYLLAALLYLKWHGHPARDGSESWAGRPCHDEPTGGTPVPLYLAATAVFVVALLSKSVTATLPAALLVVLWWQRGRLDWRRDVLPLVPWFALAAAMGLLSAWVEKKYVGAEGAEFALSGLQRALLAGRIVWFYLGKLLWPADLIFIYPRWQVDPAQAWQWLFSIAVVAALVGLWWWRGRSRAPLATALFFGGSLFPVLGFFNVFAFLYSFVADHWQYLPAIGVVALAAAGLTRMGEMAGSGSHERERVGEATSRSSPLAHARGYLRAVPAAIVVALGLLTFQQSRMYADMRTFYRTTVDRNPGAWMAHNNLGNLLREDGRLEEAVAHFQAALRAREDLPKVHNNLGSALRDLKRPTEALAHYRRAVEIAPQYDLARANLGRLLHEQGKFDEAMPQLFRAIQLNPESADARNNLGIVLRAQGRLVEALRQFELAARFEPASSPVQLNLALTLSLLGRDAEATRHYETARQLNPAIPPLPQR